VTRLIGDAILLLLFAILGFGQQPTAPFKIDISVQSSAVTTGDDVTIDVSLTNTSNQIVSEGPMYESGIELDSTLRFEILDEHGKPVPKRHYPNEELRGGSVRFRDIKPGETITQPQRVSALYDMRKPGKYTIQVWKRNRDYDIKSNILTVTVTAKEKSLDSKSGKPR
jgi:hypothetical protein